MRLHVLNNRYSVTLSLSILSVVMHFSQKRISQQRFVAQIVKRIFLSLFVCYGWMNTKAKAEGRKCNGYLMCYEAERAAACVTLCLPPTLIKVRAGLRAWSRRWHSRGSLAGWACTIAITCSEFHTRREKSRRLGWVAFTDGPVNMLERACGVCGRVCGRESFEVFITAG